MLQQNTSPFAYATRFIPGVVSAALLACSLSAAADEGGGDLRAAVQNPISSLYSLPFKFQFDYGAENGEASFLNIQPVLPVTIGEWNFVNRIIMPLIDTPGQVTGIPSLPSPSRATAPPASATSTTRCSCRR
jgi:hypothetical protein